MKKEKKEIKSIIELLSDIADFFDNISLQAIRDKCNKQRIKR